MDPADAEDAIARRCGATDAILKTGFVALGMMCGRVRDRMLWRGATDPLTGLPFESMSAWILRRAPYSYRHCHSAMTAVDELKDIPVNTLSSISGCNIAQLQKMSTQVRSNPQVLADAASLSQEEFAAKVAKDYPDQHIQPRVRVTWNLEPDVIIVMNHAIDKAMQMGCSTRERALEAIFAEFLS